MDGEETKLRREGKAGEKEKKQNFFEKAKTQVKSTKPKTLTDKKDNKEEENPPETPLGEKKRLSSQMAKQYNPSAVETWYEEKVPANIKEENARKLAKFLQELDLFQEN